MANELKMHRFNLVFNGIRHTNFLSASKPSHARSPIQLRLFILWTHNARAHIHNARTLYEQNICHESHKCFIAPSSIAAAHHKIYLGVLCVCIVRAICYALCWFSTKFQCLFSSQMDDMAGMDKLFGNIGYTSKPPARCWLFIVSKFLHSAPREKCDQRKNLCNLTARNLQFTCITWWLKSTSSFGRARLSIYSSARIF